MTNFFWHVVLVYPEYNVLEINVLEILLFYNNNYYYKIISVAASGK